jgi:sRNA-binding carbon storage regulator CsrA
MHILELAIGETLRIGPHIRVTVLGIHRESAQLRIESSSQVPVRCHPEPNDAPSNP